MRFNFFEYHDVFSIYAALQLEAVGFAIKGKGWKLAEDGEIGLKGKIPCATMGGMKARGFPGGASGVYQAVEATIQLRGQAEANQIANAKSALDPVARRASIHSGQSYFTEIGLVDIQPHGLIGFQKEFRIYRTVREQVTSRFLYGILNIDFMRCNILQAQNLFRSITRSP